LTSIAHPVLPGAVPAIGGATSPDSTSFEGRLFRASGSKAVRLGLGVAIAAVMAGDVYAVLRSPVAEGRGAGSPATMTSSAVDGARAANGVGSTAAGYVATNPFSEAAYGAALGLGSAAPAVMSRGAGPAAAAPAASSVLPSAPASGPSAAPRIVLPTTPVETPAFPGPAGPASNGGGGGGTTTPQGDVPPAPGGPLAPVADAVQDVPVVGQPVAQVVDTVDDQLPPAPAPVADAVSTVTSTVTGGSSSLLGR
jgi:hypothetical protein